MTPPSAIQALRRPVATYSIVARDPLTGEMGVAVQSHWFSVGALVPWAESGVGTVATQAFVDPSYGKLGLDLMRAGRSASDALRGLLASDNGQQVRQVAMVDARGGVAAHTGARTIAEAGHIVGDEFSVQANMMLKAQVWPEMAATFKQVKGDLAERMLAVLDAAEAAGGDIRGKQSAALLIVAATPSGRPWDDRIFDLRVEDHPQPLPELRRLVRLRRAYRHMNVGDMALGTQDQEAALREYEAAAELAPESLELRYWHAIGLVNMGRVDQALPFFRQVFKADPNFATMTPRVSKPGVIPDDPALIARILEQAK